MRVLRRLAWFQGEPARRRTPDAVFLLFALTVLGVGQLVTDTPPGSLTQLVPPIAVLCWNMGLVIFGGVSLLGVLMPPRENIIGLYLEMIGRFMLGLAAFIYVIGLVSSAGERGLFPATVLTAIGMACMIRSIQLMIYLHDFRKSVRAALRMSAEA